MEKSKRTQADKFADAARQVEASDDPADFDRALKGIAKAPPPKTVQERKEPKAKKPAR
jgi:hypothetical protein